jgi:hypothetical protein
MRDLLFVQSTTELGGAETVLLNLLAASEPLRRRSTVVTLGSSVYASAVANFIRRFDVGRSPREWAVRAGMARVAPHSDAGVSAARRGVVVGGLA